MPRKISYAELEQTVSHLRKQQGLHAIALQYQTLDVPDLEVTALTKDFAYYFQAFGLQAPHGGIVILRSCCRTNQQRDSVTPHYVDEITQIFPPELGYSDVHKAIYKIHVERSQRNRLEVGHAEN